MPVKIFSQEDYRVRLCVSNFFLYDSSRGIQSDFFASDLGMENAPKSVNLVISNLLIGIWDLATLNHILNRYTHGVTWATAGILPIT